MKYSAQGSIHPELSDEEFPEDEKSRHFSNFHYNRILKNGEKLNW
jgi:hypothetical protein